MAVDARLNPPPCLERRRWLRWAGLLGAAIGPWPVLGRPRDERSEAGPSVSQARPLVIAHRGASGQRPEHTLAAYALAIEQGADHIEVDLVSTRDGVLVARHENALALLDADGKVREATTDVAERARFADRCTTKTIDGRRQTGWFTEDFTLAELKTLRARERMPQLRAANTRWDDQFEVPTFEEVLHLIDQVNARRRSQARDEARASNRPAIDRPAIARPVGVYPETKHPSYFRHIGLPLEEPLVALLDRYGYGAADAPVFIQSFEVESLRRLRRMTGAPLVQLLAARGRPYDFSLSGDARGYRELAQPAGLTDVATYAQGIGVQTSLIFPQLAGRLGEPTPLVRNAHAAGLRVHAWTVRAENAFLPDDFDVGGDPHALGDMAGWVHALLAQGVDGFFTDHPEQGRRARDAFVAVR